MTARDIQRLQQKLKKGNQALRVLEKKLKNLEAQVTRSRKNFKQSKAAGRKRS